MEANASGICRQEDNARWFPRIGRWQSEANVEEASLVRGPSWTNDECVDLGDVILFEVGEYFRILLHFLKIKAIGNRPRDALYSGCLVLW